jgi:hypothetical protein
MRVNVNQIGIRFEDRRVLDQLTNVQRRIQQRNPDVKVSLSTAARIVLDAGLKAPEIKALVD